MSVSSLSDADLASAIRQIVAAPGFAPANPHLSVAQRQAIASGQWPNEPVFTPYAVTHHGYSQIRYRNIKYLTHRITYQSLHHNIDTRDVSHTMYLGKNTSRNINPRHLILEENILNQTRKQCALVMEHLLYQWAIGDIGHQSWSDADFEAWVQRVNFGCRITHASHRCSCRVAHWEELESLEDLSPR